ncbi:hypothetical protein [Thalassobacillus sp. C254]|uniref:hypothetical protein n=1 Tax=Thalassobacillus sp. C254 TaxID=1225341 RepID=UPI0006D0F72A|nr:hypothetical protein [Thalassobacillus sp. C254]
MTSLLIILFLSIWGFYTAIRIKKSTHMLQLNSYRNERIWKWMNEHKDLVYQRKDFWPLLAIIPLIFGAENTALLLGTALYGLNIYFQPKVTEKKKLVFTPRVKRLLATIGILYLIVAVVAALIGAGARFPFFGL